MFKDDSYIRYEVTTDSGNVYTIELVKTKRKIELPEINKEDLSFWKESFVSEKQKCHTGLDGERIDQQECLVGVLLP